MFVLFLLKVGKLELWLILCSNMRCFTTYENLDQIYVELRPKQPSLKVSYKIHKSSYIL